MREGRGCETREKQIVKRNNSAPWGRVLVPHEGIHTTISLSCFAATETPTRWEKLTICCPQARRPQTSWNQKDDDTDSHLPHHQPIRRTSTSLSHPLYYKTPHCLLQVRTHSFEGINPLWSPLPGKAIKLFFSTSPKTLSLRINSVSGYRSHTQLYQDPQNPNF